MSPQKNKIPQQVYDMIEQITINSYTWRGQRAKRKFARVHNIDAITAMEARLVAMIEQKIGNMNLTPSKMNLQ